MGEFYFGNKAHDGGDNAGGELNYHSYGLAAKGRLKRMGLHVYDASGQKVKGAIYQGTNPKIAESPEWTVPGGGFRQIEIEFSAEDRKIILDVGAYNLAHMQTGGKLVFDATPSGNQRWYFRAYDGFPSTLASGSRINAKLTIWVVLDEIWDGSAELKCTFQIFDSGSAELLGKAEVGQNSADLLGKFEVAQDSADLLARFEVGQSSAELLGEFVVSQSSAELLGKFAAQVTAELLGKAVVRQSDSAELLGEVDVRQSGSAELLGKFEAQGVAELLGEAVIKNTGSAELLGNVEVNKPGSAELLSKTEIQQSGSAELLGNVEVQQSGSAELLSNFRVTCPRRMGGNWQRKMWFDGTYYWRGRYCPTDDALKFEYIASSGLAGNVWAENAAARIDASGFTGILADFTVRGGESGLSTTIHYSNGVDSLVAESDEASATGWAWQNTTTVFDGTAPDYYRKVNLAANRTTPTPRLWAVAVFYDDSGGEQWVKARRQSTGGDITGWDAEVDVSNVANTDTIYGCSVRSMGAAGLVKNDIMVVYKEDVALRSRYYDGDWNDPIEDIDTSTLSGRAAWDFEQGEVAGEDEGHIIYVDSDTSIKWRERDAGAASTWSAAEQLEAAAASHRGVGIIEHGSGSLWVAWVHGNGLEFRLHECATEAWDPALANDPLFFDVATDAVVKTSTVYQPNTPDQIPASEAVPICWIGETAPTTPCDVGWGILVEYSIASLKGVFNVRQPSSVELLGKFEVGQDSTDLLARFEAQGVADLLGKFEAQGVADLLGNAEIQQSGSVELLGRFEAQGIADLLANVEVQQSGSAELLGRFEAQGVADLLGNVGVQQSGSAELLGRFEAQGVAELLGRFEAQAIADILGKFDVGQDSQDLLGRFEAQVTADLLGKFDVGQDSQLLARFEAQGVADLLAKFEAQVTADLLGKFDVGQDSQELLGKFEAQGVADLLARFEAQGIADLLGKFEAQGVADLLGKFDVGQDSQNLLANVKIQQSGSAELLGNVEVQQLGVSDDLISNFYVSPSYLTADEMLIGGRDRRMDLGGLDREMVVGGRDRRMKIK